MSRSDEEAIRALVISYAELLDAGDLDGVAALFAHGEFRSAHTGSSRRGAAEVRRMYDPVLIYDDGTPRTKHVLGNLVVEVDDAARTGRASCTFTVLQQVEDGGLGAVLAGRYVDRFAQVDGEWRFAERTVHPDLVGALAQHMGGS